MDKNKMLCLVYDTLMANRQFEQFESNKAENQHIDFQDGTIIFEYDGKCFKLELTEIEPNYKEMLENALSWICEHLENADEYLNVCEHYVKLTPAMMDAERENFMEE